MNSTKCTSLYATALLVSIAGNAQAVGAANGMKGLKGPRGAIGPDVPITCATPDEFPSCAKLKSVSATGFSAQAVQAAIDTAAKQGASFVRLPAGDYNFGASTVTVSVPNLTIYGEGSKTLIRTDLPLLAGGGTPKLFDVTANRTRITRLVLQGPDQTVNETNLTFGVYVSSAANVRIDHVEARGFGFAAISYAQNATGQVDHAFIHHNLRAGYGYGVAVREGAYVLIEDNKLSQARHMVATNGWVDFTGPRQRNLPGRATHFTVRNNLFSDDSLMENPTVSRLWALDAHPGMNGTCAVERNIFEKVRHGLNFDDGTCRIEGNLFREPQSWEPRAIWLGHSLHPAWASGSPVGAMPRATVLGGNTFEGPWFGQVKIESFPFDANSLCHFYVPKHTKEGQHYCAENVTVNGLVLPETVVPTKVKPPPIPVLSATARELLCAGSSNCPAQSVTQKQLTYYVDTNHPSAADTNPGSATSPLKTIQAGVNKAVAGTTVYVRAGVYNEQVEISNSGTAGASISIESYPGERAIIDSNFTKRYGIKSGSSYMRIKGFEIRNVKFAKEPVAGIQFWDSSDIVLEDNIVHEIIGDYAHGSTYPSMGINIRGQNITVRNNTVYQIVGSGMSTGIMGDVLQKSAIQNNLVYLADKEGIRVICNDHDTLNVVENNITIHNRAGISVNTCRPVTQSTIVRNNFSALNWGLAIQVKHARNTVLDHNTIVNNGEYGVDLHQGGNVAGDVYYPVVKNNLFSNNEEAWLMIEDQVFNESVDYNFYQYTAGKVLAELGWRTSWPNGERAAKDLAGIRAKTQAPYTKVAGPYDLNSKEGDPRFRKPAGGDYRLASTSSASGAGSDGKNMGASEKALTGVGANKAYGLSNIPSFGLLRSSAASWSSEASTGLASAAFDGAYPTYWEIDLTKDLTREIIVNLPRNDLHQLTYLTLAKYDNGSGDASPYMYKTFEVYADDGSGVWTAVPSNSGHPFVGFECVAANGESWSLPVNTRARRVKLKFIDGYGTTIRIPEIRLYGSATASLRPRK